MFLKLLFTFSIWFSFGINGNFSQDNTCLTPDQKYGLCININNCTSLMSLLLTQGNNPQARNFLRNSVCGYVGQIPWVCCPQRSSKSLETTTESINDGTVFQNETVIKLPTSPNCGFSNISTSRIVNGVPAKLGEFPWIVALGYRNTKNPQSPKWLCGGSLITNKHILTAAHCVHNRPDLYIARLGDLDLYSNDDGATPETIALVKAKIHENYDPYKYTNDIAVLTMQKSPTITTVWPICLPVKAPFRSMSYLNFSPTLAGWGSVTFKGPSNTALHYIFVPVMDNEACERVFRRQALIDGNIICAGSTNGDKDACGGDSGGPLMNMINEDNNYRVYAIGIVSYGFRCAEPGYPGVYTRVTAFIDWIENNLN